ncbi:MAG: TonB-dependent receptor [Sulfuritalea sp.]|jgi:iron complex outermembrane receptor protein|nr:TonB-dependent receptor [Sulfuritalea sp.]
MPKTPLKLVCVLGVLACTVANAAQVSEEEELAMAYGDKATVSIATGVRQDLRRAPAVATVITAEDIKATGATGLDEVMETVPGVHVSHTADRYFSTYMFRGIASMTTNPQVLMLQNGVPVNTLYRGDKGEVWGNLPLENLARIEIIRGPGSALYGADALAGVINIITKTAADTPGTEFGLSAGSFNTQSAWVQHGGKLGEVDVAAYLRVGGTDGYNGTIDYDAATRLNQRFGTHTSLAPGSLKTGHDAIDASLDLGYDKWRLRAGYKLRDNLGLGAGVSYALDPVGKEKSERINADVSWSDPQFARNWGLGFNGSYLAYSEEANNYNINPPGIKIGGNTFPNGMIGSPGRWEKQLRVSGYATYSGFAGHSLRFGVGHDDLNLYRVRTMKNFYLDPNTGAPTPDLAFNGGAVVDYSSRQPHLLPHRRLNDYWYVQDEWNFARDWTLTAGIRRDKFSDFGATTNPRLALVWDATVDLTAKLLYGQAFRAPAFNDQYGVNPTGDGNPNLKPERIRTVEAAFAWQARKDTQVNLSLFQYLQSDTIRAVANAVGTSVQTFQNTGKQDGHGAEFELVWDANRSLRLTGNYSWQVSTDQTTNTDAGYAPHHHVYARADWRFTGNWMLSPQLNWVADRKRAFGDTRPDVPDYTSVDLTLRTERGKGQWSFAASIRNLFDATILEPTLFAAPVAGRPDIPTSLIPYDLPMPSRSFYLQATYSL